LREIVKQNVEDARQDTERVRNVNAKPHDFQIGQRVFVSQLLESSKIKNKRHSPQYVGPYVIIDSHASLVRLQHYYTGKILKNWINVCHLKRLKDESRLKLYNRLKANESDSDTTPDVEQRTVQTMLGSTLSHHYEPRAFNTSYNRQTERSGWNALTESQPRKADRAGMNIWFTVNRIPLLTQPRALIRHVPNRRQLHGQCSHVHKSLKHSFLGSLHYRQHL
jgi:hypothetical protein